MRKKCSSNREKFGAEGQGFAKYLRLLEQFTVFPHIVTAETILFWIWESKGHSALE